MEMKEMKMTNKHKVLFICVHNSARSQMAEAWANLLCGDLMEAESAGLEPGTIHPLTIKVMKEVGIDLSNKKTQSVFDLVKKGKIFSFVITVCDESNAERCPVFPGITKRIHWSIPDPAAANGSEDEKIETFRKIRDSIRDKVEDLCREIKNI